MIPNLVLGKQGMFHLVSEAENTREGTRPQRKNMISTVADALSLRYPWD